MIVVDHELVFSGTGGMGSKKMRVPRREIGMAVRNHFRIIFRPQQESRDRSDTRHDCERGEGRRLARERTNLSRQWIADQPAPVAQGELGREQRRSIVRIGGAAEQSPRRRDAH